MVRSSLTIPLLFLPSQYDFFLNPQEVLHIWGQKPAFLTSSSPLVGKQSQSACDGVKRAKMLRN